MTLSKKSTMTRSRLCVTLWSRHNTLKEPLYRFQGLHRRMQAALRGRLRLVKQLRSPMMLLATFLAERPLFMEEKWRLLQEEAGDESCQKNRVLKVSTTALTERHKQD